MSRKRNDRSGKRIEWGNSSPVFETHWAHSTEKQKLISPRHSSGLALLTLDLSFLPYLCRQRQFVKFRTSFSPTRVVLPKDCEEAVTVFRLQKMYHFVDDNVFQEVHRFFHQFRI